MEIAELKQQCESLSPEERRELANYLLLRDSGRKPLNAERCKTLLGYMSRIYGREILPNCRDAWCVWSRTFVAYQMLIEGYSVSEIGRQMNKDHTTIIHLRKKMEDVFDLPQAYQDILPIWEQFQKRINL